MAYFWWETAKILYFMGLDFENLYGRNTIGFTAWRTNISTSYDLGVEPQC
jgi:hypothetical protein